MKNKINDSDYILDDTFYAEMEHIEQEKKQHLVESIKHISCLHFYDQISNGDISVEFQKSITTKSKEPSFPINTIGYIRYLNRNIIVSLLLDASGRYIELSDMIENVENISQSVKILSMSFIHGRFEVHNNNIRFFTLIPIIAENILQLQLTQGLAEIHDMTTCIQNQNKQMN